MTIRSFEGKSPVVPDSSYVDPAALVIGAVQLGEDVSIWPMSVARGDIGAIRIGARTNIQDGSVLHVTHASRFFPAGFDLTIGHDVTVGHRVTLHGCTVGDGCLIGMGVTVMDGAVVPAGTLIGAGALVTPGQELESGYLWLGRPAKRIRRLSDDEIAYFAYSSAHYVDIKNRHVKEAE